MKLRRAREVEIGCLAEVVAMEFFPEGMVLPLDIVEAESLTYSFGSYRQAYDGLLEHKNGRFHVYCNLDRVDHPNSPRARFTLAHELGHYYIDEHRNALRSGYVPSHPSFCEYASESLVEKEVDHFASHLLMPDERFRRVALEEDIGLPAILASGEAFGTSVTSTAIKYVRTGLIVSAIIKWKPDKFDWKWLSDTMHQMGYRKTIEKLHDVPRDSATARLLGGDVAPEQGFFDSRTTASDWFPYVQEGSEDDVAFIEQAISLGAYGFLTFLYPEEEEG